LISFAEMFDSFNMVRGAAPNTLVLADGDHGYGNAMNVQRTVRAYGRAGAAAILIEDKITPRALTAAGKPCLFFSQDERIPPSRLGYGTLIRSSIFEKLPHERAHPVFILDIKEETGGAYPEVIAKGARPEVGFCGYVGTPLSRLGLRILGARAKVDGLAFRAKVLGAMRRDQGVDCRFIARGTYLGAAPLSAFRRDHPLADQRQAFLANLMESPYALAMRGKGNHSVRFYEILSAGRIPVFVNTACVLPLESEIDWKKYSVWVEESELPRIGRHLREFHDRIGAEEFVDLQSRIRSLWLERLRPEPYFKHVLEVVASGSPFPR
jgi:hypothetical protein